MSRGMITFKPPLAPQNVASNNNSKDLEHVLNLIKIKRFHM